MRPEWQAYLVYAVLGALAVWLVLWLVVTLFRARRRTGQAHRGEKP